MPRCRRTAKKTKPKTKTARGPIRSQRRIVFLDFDGVLNDHHFLSSISNAKKKGLTVYDDQCWHEMINPENIVHLNRIVEATNAEVVICSSWRHAHPTDKLEGFLKARGFVGRVVGMTPTLSGEQRGEECAAWLEAQRTVGRPAWSFVALDDERDYEPIMDRLVHTSFHLGGLCDEHVEPAIALLNTPCAGGDRRTRTARHSQARTA